MDISQVPQNKPLLVILLAEDNELNQFLINQVLSDWNMEVHTVLNGLEALQKIAEINFDLILMDMEMPLMDGYEAIRKIRLLDGINADLPIISLTAHSEDSEIEKCLAAGANAYVSKPFEPDELLQTIQQLTTGT